MIIKHRTKCEHRRRYILSAAEKMFLEHGFSSVTMAGIAARAGVSKQTVFSHFGNKKNLFDAVLAAQNNALDYADLLAQEESCESALLALAGAYSAILLSPSGVDAYIAAVTENTQNREIAQQLFENHTGAARKALCAYLASCDEVDIPAPDWAAEQLLGMIVGVARMEVEAGLTPAITDGNRADYERQVVQGFLRMYALQRQGE